METIQLQLSGRFNFTKRDSLLTVDEQLSHPFMVIYPQWMNAQLKKALASRLKTLFNIWKNIRGMTSTLASIVDLLLFYHSSPTKVR